MRALVLVLLLGGCGRIDFDGVGSDGGTVSDACAPPTRITQADNASPRRPALAGTEAVTAIAWLDERSGIQATYAATLDDSNAVIRENAVSTSLTAPQLAWTGANFAFVAARSGGIELVRLSTNLDALDATPIALTSASASSPKVVWTGSELAVTWGAGDTSIGAATFAADGTPIGSTSVATDPAGSRSPTLARAAPDRFLVAWDDERDTGSLAEREIYVAAIGAGFSAGPDIRWTNVAGNSIFPSLGALGADLFGLAWQENRAGDYDVYWQLLDGSGTALGPDVRLTDVGAGNPVVAVGTSAAAVAINAYPELRVQMFTLDGAVAGAPLLVSTTLALDPDVTISAIGGAFRVAWIDNRDGVKALYATTCAPAP